MGQQPFGGRRGPGRRDVGEGRSLDISAQPADPRGSRSAKSYLKPCGYVGTGGVSCRFKALPGHRYCFWHEATAPKDGPLVGALLTRFVREDANLEGYQLAGINLERGQRRGAHFIHTNLEGASLYRASLDGAQLFGANLKDANLYNASLADANLRSTNLDGANLLGANLKGARLEGAEMGRHSIVINETRANREARQGNNVEACKYWREAEEIYLALLNNHREAGRNEEASEMFYRMMVVKRKVLPKVSVARWGSWFMDAVCGYGERPMRIVSSCLVLVLGCAALFFLVGIKSALTGDAIGFSTAISLGENLKNFGLCIYFSTITMTTTGYGDFIPVDATRSLAATEAFLGSFLMAVFILVFTRKMMR